MNLFSRLFVDMRYKTLVDIEVVPIYVGKDEFWLEKMIQADKNKNDELLGRCYGYPDTAIEAFVGRRQRYEKRIGGISIAFTGFIFSQDNYEQGLQECSIRWQLTVQQLSPQLHDLLSKEAIDENLEKYFSREKN